MKINLASRELPRYTAAGDDQSRAHTGGVFIGPSIDYMQRAFEDARGGRPGRLPFFSVHTQSALDPSVAPPGKATLSIFTQYFPYDLAEGTWDERREEIADHAISRYAEYAPNVPGCGHRAAGLGSARYRSALRPDRRPHLPGRIGAGAGVRHAAGAGIEGV